MADAKRALVIDFKAKGSPQLIKAINKLATAQPVSYTHLTLPTTPYV